MNYEWYYELVEKAMEEITFGNLTEMLNNPAVEIWKALQEKVKGNEC